MDILQNLLVAFIKECRLRNSVTAKMPIYLVTLMLAMAMVHSTTASPVYGRGAFGRVMLEDQDKGFNAWNVEKVSE